MDKKANLPVAALRPTPSNPELEPLLATLFTLIDEVRSVVVHVSSVRHGEGTTTLMLELAAATAATKWCKVALIDAGGGIARTVGEVPGPSLLEQFENSIDPVLRKGYIGAAEVSLGRLKAEGGAARLDDLRGLYRVLKADYNLILVDCPPTSAGQHEASWARVADGVVLVIEAERTRITDLSHARTMLEQVGATILGVVINKRRRRIPRLISRFL